MNNKDVAVTAMREMFGNHDTTVVDRLMTNDYRQHGTAADGPEGTRQIIASFHEGVRYESHRVIADGDLVFLQGLYHGFAPVPLVAFDMLRIRDGKLAEHWDALTPLLDSASPTQVDGPTEVAHTDSTEASRALVTEFVEKVLKGGDTAAQSDYVLTEGFVQHDPAAADGQIVAPGATYDTIHKVVAEGDTVLVVTEGDAAGAAVALWDLFRVADGKIAEHWAVTAPVVADLPHSNGAF